MDTEGTEGMVTMAAMDADMEATGATNNLQASPKSQTEHYSS